MTTALYRRYRPETFAEVIGQEHVTAPLSAAIQRDRVNHAYLFSGPRGCGKTTSARILARCLNCATGPTPNPCGECDSCRALARGGPGSLDVIEIDAASHRGIDDAREIRDRAAFAPASSRFKIFIIDEAHMVTKEGFNALLKIVEEPPPHVKFIFATTEPEKVIGTIRSRTHHYPFRLVPPGVLQEYLSRLCDQEGISVAPGVLPLVVRAGGGSVRDSLSVLDQLMAGASADGVTYPLATALLGYTDGELLDSVVEALAAGDGATVFRMVDRVIESGHDPRRFVEDLLERLRDLLVVAAVPDDTQAVLRGTPDDQLERMRLQASAYGKAELSRAADITNAALTEMTGATSPRLQLELLCARLLLPGSEDGERGLGARLERLERRVSLGVPAVAPVGVAATGAPSGVSTAAPAAGSAGASAAPRTGGPASGASGPVPGSVTQTPGSAGSAPGVVGVPGPVGEVPGPAGEAPGSAGTSPGSPGPGPDDAGTAPGSGAASSSGTRPGAAREAADAGAGASQPAQVVGGAVNVEAVRAAWPDVLEQLSRVKRATWSLVSQHAQVTSVDASRLVLRFSSPGLASTFGRGAHQEFLRQALISTLGLDVAVEAVGGDAPVPGPSHRGPGAGGPAGASTPGSVLRTSAPTQGSTPATAASPARPDGSVPGGPPAGAPSDARTGPGSAPQARTHPPGDDPWARPAQQPGGSQRPAGSQAAGSRAAGSQAGGDQRPAESRPPGDDPWARPAQQPGGNQPPGDDPWARPAPEPRAATTGPVASAVARDSGTWGSRTAGQGPQTASRAAQATGREPGPAEGGPQGTAAAPRPSGQGPWSSGRGPAARGPASSPPGPAGSAPGVAASAPGLAASAPGVAASAPAPAAEPARPTGPAAARAAVRSQLRPDPSDQSVAHPPRLHMVSPDESIPLPDEPPDEPSPDDRDIEDSHLVGAPVVAKLLGGRVIEERTE